MPNPNASPTHCVESYIEELGHMTNIDGFGCQNDPAAALTTFQNLVNDYPGKKVGVRYCRFQNDGPAVVEFSIVSGAL